MTTDFVVLGERRDDPSQLLLRGDDGQFYVYDLGTAHVSAIDVDETWAIDARPRPSPGARPDPPPADAGFG